MFEKFKKNRLYYIALFMIIVEQFYIVFFLLADISSINFVLITLGYVMFDIFTFFIFSYIYTLRKYQADQDFFTYAPKSLQYIHRFMPSRIKVFLIFTFLPLYEFYLVKPIFRVINAVRDYLNQPADAFYALAAFHIFSYVAIFILYIFTSGNSSLFDFEQEIHPFQVIAELILVYWVCRADKRKLKRL